MVRTDGVVSSWGRIVCWLENNAPVTARALNQPAGDAEIRTLNNALGFPVPAELESWLRRNNGSADAGLFPGAEVFLDCARIADRYRNHRRIAEDIGDADWWLPSWIPVLAVADAHYGLLLDAGRSESGAPAPVLAFRETDHAGVHAPSLGHVLTAVADVLEQGGGAGALTRGRNPFVRDGRLDWN
ncbi:SMI1/KNR4 family protein [Streptomyces sp. NBC_01077]|uniref:SMI1/KNR4 family protein n=1 Tax=Streptomyces sp. NBC_01077 TaxID=2903746 RepID=UPI00386B29D8|nr:SMI1/KNR4 family protein [Streptomyces sp. NBC_01077]